MGVVDAFAKKTLPPADLKEISIKTRLGFTDKALMDLYPNLLPNVLAEARGLQDTPQVSAWLGLPNGEAIAKEAADRRLSEAKAIEAEYPELKGKPEVTQ